MSCGKENGTGENNSYQKELELKRQAALAKQEVKVRKQQNIERFLSEESDSAFVFETNRGNLIVKLQLFN